MKFNYIFLASIIFSFVTSYSMKPKKSSFLERLKQETAEWEERQVHKNAQRVDTFELARIKQYQEKLTKNN